MRRIPSSILSTSLVAGAMLLAYATPSRAQDAPKPKTVGAANVELYAGGTAAAEGIKLGGWGSGMAVEDKTNRTTGEESLRVQTNGFYAGARLQYEVPKDLTAQKSDPAGFLKFVIKFQPGKLKKMQQNMGYPGGSGGYPGGSGSSGFSQGSSGFGSTSGGSGFGSTSGGSGFGDSPGGSPGGYPGGPGGFPGAGGYPGSGGSDQTITPDTKKMKVMLVCDEGLFTASNFPVSMIPSQEENWYQVAIPWVAFKGLDKAQAVHVKELRIFGDAPDTFWVGSIETTTDDEPINVEPMEPQEVSVGEAVEFKAVATGGISPLVYVWDFGDGTVEESNTPDIVHVWRKQSPDLSNQPGERQPYQVKLTVKDLSGAKAAARKTVDVTVNP